MTSNNINKIVRGNSNLKPWLLSKNSTDIVNSYVQKLYQQLPENFRNDLYKPRFASEQQELQSSLRSAKASMSKFTFPIAVNKPKTKIRSNCYRSPPITVQNSFVSPKKNPPAGRKTLVNSPEKFLNTPNFKIYSNRKFGSNASSSTASFFRGDHEERRKKMYKPANGMQFRNFTGTATATFYNNPGVAKYIAPNRLFNDLSQQAKCLEITNTICKDLMSVDKILKDKIRMARPKLSGDTSDKGRQDMMMSSFKGLNNPSTSTFSKLKEIVTKSPLNKGIFQQGLSCTGPPSAPSAERRPYAGTIPLPRREKNRHQASNIAPNGGVNSKSRQNLEYNSRESGSHKTRVPDGRDPNDLVCRSRTSRSRKTLKGNSQVLRKFL